jgi:hypothetical protein
MTMYENMQKDNTQALILYYTNEIRYLDQPARSPNEVLND